jgi:predicted ATPase
LNPKAMIEKIRISSFKSIQDVEIELGVLNVFVGANGSGKSNLLEAIGVLSAAAEGKVTDQTLLQKGVRPGVPKLYKSSFKSNGHQQPPHIRFKASCDAALYEVSLHNPLTDPSPAWRYKTERFERGATNIASRGTNMKQNPNKELGLAALNAISLEESDLALRFIRQLQNYVIYSPTTPVLRGVAPETQPRQPVGLSGGRLPEAVEELHSSRSVNASTERVESEALSLIEWADSYKSGRATDLPLSPAASSSPTVIRFVDRFMQKDRNVLSGYDASEGALYILFLAVLSSHLRSPAFFAIDNADHGLNPGLAKELIKKFSGWLISANVPRQVLMTSHNPAILDGLPLKDDRVRLFTVDRDNTGRTQVKRVVVTSQMEELANKGWTLSRLWMSGRIGGMPSV